MGLLILANELARRGRPGENLMLWVLLALAVGLTFWECRSRGYRTVVTLWWMSLTAITHVIGYLVLKFLVRAPSES